MKEKKKYLGIFCYRNTMVQSLGQFYIKFYFLYKIPYFLSAADPVFTCLKGTSQVLN